MWARCPRSLFPGLRLGFMVGPKELIAEARALRRLMVRHAPNNNQRTAALFLSLGHHDTLIRRLHRAYRTRWEIMGKALEQHFPASSPPAQFRRHQFLGEGAGRPRQRSAGKGCRGQEHPHRAGSDKFRKEKPAAELLPPGLLLHR